ncbi:Vacuolar sorting protein 9 (VPS9) domain [Phytophthora infestans]|uniref:Vacuolar sorting protein 9 (VPS9) domain n=1 Tax=Phytophthora infestans TaxID=4787 RepID=A0A833WCI4_PHYIN|nr:Vacuolar sorting protein 9 (VPS9) domain [Phytophthora infestans]
MAGKTPSLPRSDSGPPVSARDASYWLAVACTPSSSRSGAATNISATSSTRSLDASSFLLSLRSNSSSSVLDGNKSLLELRSHLNLPQQESLDIPPPSSLYDSSLYAPTRVAAHQSAKKRNKRQNQRATARTESKKPVIVAEEVYEHQRYQMVLSWGSRGHLLPLDPDKYMRVVRHSIQRRRRRTHSREQTQDEDDVLLEWSPSSTFPDIPLPDPQAGDRPPPASIKQRSRSATSASRASTADRAHNTATSVSGSSLTGPRWEWVSPWHLENPVNSPKDAVDGWQYASSFSHFTPRPSLRSRGRSIESSSQIPSQLDGEMPSLSPVSLSGKRLRVRRRKWVRYRRLRSGRSSRSTSTSSSAFDDAFLDSMSGWLRKRGHVRKNWKARYFVLEKSVLRYYTDSSCAKLKGEVLLFHPQTRVHYVDVHVAGGRDASFAIQVGPDYTLLLQAAQLRDRENWMYCIEDALLCRDSYHPQGRAGPYFDLRESVAQRRLLSAEAMALDGSSFRDNLGGISHAHGGAAGDELSDEEDGDDQSGAAPFGQRGSGGDVLRLWASLHAKPGGVLSAVSSASPTLRSLLRSCDQFLASLTMRQHIASFLVMFRQKYEHPAASAVTAIGTSAWTRLSEPWAPGLSGNESDSDQEVREGSLGASPVEVHNVTTLQDARSLLALKNYRFFLERALELIMEHLSTLANPTTPRQLGDAALNGKRAPTDDEWALARRAALYKLERRTFIPLQEVIYQLLGAGRGQQQEEEERFERLRALVAAQPQSFLEIRLSHQSPSEWKSAVALLNCMDNYSLPSEKAAVLVEVARCIYETHAREHGSKVDRKGKTVQPTLMAADDFLPIFIFVLARCQLRSVIVARHLISETMITALMIGETGYYATMLEAAIGYIAAFDGAAKADEMANRNSGSGSTAFSSF